MSLQVYVDRDGMELKAFINPDGKSGSIIMASTGHPIVSFVATSLHKIRIKLKKGLQGLGVRFAKEKRVREKKNGETSGIENG
ncbi:MAG: hypothetical protein ACK53L_01460 [Pirellulaceae bacterium]